MASEVTYRIRDWDKHFEVSQSKKVRGQLPWIAVPTKHDGQSYRRLMRMEDGPSLYAAWLLIAQVAAKCPTRGTLFNDGRPLTPDDLEIKTDCPAAVFRKAFKVLCDAKIGWLEVVSNGPDTTTVDQATTTVDHDTTLLPTRNERTNERTDEHNERSVDSIESRTGDLENTLGTHPVCADLKRKLKPKSQTDRRLIGRLAVLVDAGEVLAADVGSAAQGASCKPRRTTIGYFTNTLRNACNDRGRNLDGLLARVRFTTGPPDSDARESVTTTAKDAGIKPRDVY